MSEVTWCALESNPETINPFLNRLGIKDVECVDVFSFDEEMLPFVPTPQHALILCFPSDEFMKESYAEMEKKGRDEVDDVFFMKQKIHNACGTFALFHSLANLEGTVDLGNGPFVEWLQKAKSHDEETRSDILAQDDVLAAAHEEAAASGETAQSEQVDYHFITYVARKGNLYEIDSCSPGPRLIGPTTAETLVRDASKAIKVLMEKINNHSFAAMALVGKK